MDDFFSCIIPFYNEKDRILDVLSAVTKVKQISQIICIDDGSRDNTSTSIEQIYPQITLIKLEQNTGKANAIREGINRTINNNLILLDADYEGLITEELQKAINTFLQDDRIDLLILENKGDKSFIDHLLRKDIFLSGKRLMKKQDLQEVLINPIKNYELEVSINRHMMANHKNVFWAKNSAINPHKSRKRPYLIGLKKDLEMEKEIITCLGIVNYLKQTLLFCRKELVLE